MTFAEKPHCWLLSCWLLCCQATVLLALPREKVLPREKDAWIELSTAHFTLYSGLSRTKTQKIARHLEQLRAVLGQVTAWDLAAPAPTYIYVFSHDKAFAPYKNLYNGKDVDGSGYLLTHPDSSFIAINGGAIRDPERLLYHEYVHHILGNNIRELPLWLNEGLAEYYSTFRISGGRAEIGLPVDEHLASLRSGLIPLADLFAIDVKSAEYNEGGRRGVFYAQSWALAHYLMQGDKASLDAVLLNKASLDAVSLNKTLTADDRAIERALENYVASRELPTVRVDVYKIDIPPRQVREMAYPEVLRRLGNLLARLERHAAAAEHFEAARQRQPGNALALAGLADLARRQNRFDEALALYRRSLQTVNELVVGDRARVHYLYAECLLASGDADQQTLSRAIQSLSLSVALLPRFASAQTLLANTRDALQKAGIRRALALLKEQRPDEALGLLEKLRDAASPEDRLRIEEEIHKIRSTMDRNRWAERYNEAVDLLRNGQRESAKALLEELVTVSGGSQAESVRTLLEKISREERLEAATQQVNQLLADGHPEQAIEVLEQVGVPADSPEGRWTLDQITRIRRSIERQRFLDSFNEAMRHLDVGDAKSAARVLEKLLATLPEGSSEAERTRVLLVKARAELKRRGG